MDTRVFDFWIEKSDEKTIKEISQMSDSEKQKAFGSPLTFGTAGVRAKMGPGPSLLNKYTVRQIALAYLEFLKQKWPLYTIKKKGIVIFHDNRANSYDFAIEAAKILSDSNVLVYLAHKNELKTTPFLSYCIRILKAAGGMNFTASHNPKEYNGCKVYNEFGCQLLPEDTQKIQKFLPDFQEQIFNMKCNGYLPLICELPEKIELGFVETIKQNIFNYNLPKRMKILFSPQCGTTYEIIPNLFNELGFEMTIFPKTATPNPEFKGVHAINPEDVESFSELITFAKKDKYINLILIADPDGDRVGIAYKNRQDKFVILHGNEVATLLTNYLCMQMKKVYKLRHEGFIVSTMVSGDLPGEIARSYNYSEIKTSTGFKWIGNEIERNIHNKKFIFAFEEAIGYLTFDGLREKDSIQTSLVFCDMMNFYLNQEQNLDDVLMEIYSNFGFYQYKTIYLESDNLQKIEYIFTNFLRNNISSIGQLDVVDKKIITNKFDSSPTIKIFLSKDNNSWVAIRKSGTEPKLKFYITIRDVSVIAAKDKINKIEESIKNIIR
ncbi:MAG: phospho-sugar mutase [Mycoplasma sp.]